MALPAPYRQTRGSTKGGTPTPGRRAAPDHHRRRRRTWTAAAASGVVVVVVAVLVGVGLSSQGAKAAPRTAVPPGTAHALQSVPVGSLVAASSQVTGLQPATRLIGPALKSAGKPEVLYIGAEFCPVCAAQRWALVVALSQFGTFTNLQQTSSAARDGNIPTLSFYGSSYSSPYLTFTPVETTTNQPQGNFYAPLETPTPAQQALWSSTLGGNLSFPFIDIGAKYLLTTSQFPVASLQGHSFTDVAASVGHNNTDVGAAIDSSAASLVKYICAITGQKPAATCQAVANVNAAVSASSANASAG